VSQETRWKIKKERKFYCGQRTLDEHATNSLENYSEKFDLWWNLESILYQRLFMLNLLLSLRTVCCLQNSDDSVNTILLVLFSPNHLKAYCVRLRFALYQTSAVQSLALPKALDQS